MADDEKYLKRIEASMRLDIDLYGSLKIRVGKISAG
jgi:hypothetical protein